MTLSANRWRFLAEAFWTGSGRLAVGIASFLLVRALTHRLPAGTYANLLLLIGAVSLLAGVAMAFLSNAVNRFYYEMTWQGRHEEFLATGWLALASTAAVGVPAVLVLIPLLGTARLNWPANLLLVLLFGSSLVVRFGQSLLGIARRRRAWALLALVEAVAASTAVVLLSLWIRPTWQLVVLAYTAGSMVSALLTFLYVCHVRELPERGHWSAASRSMLMIMFTFGWPTMLSALAAWVLGISDRYLLNYLLGAKEIVAYYSVAYQAGNLLPQIVGAPYVMLVGPHIMRAYQPERGQVPQLELWLGLFTWFAVPAFIFSLLFSKQLLLLLAPKAYLVARRVVPFSCLSLLLSSFDQLTSMAYHLQKKLLFPVAFALVAGSINLGLNLFLIPRYGFMAAAFSTVAAYGFQCVVSSACSRRFLHWQFPWKWLGIAALSALISALVTQTMRFKFPLIEQDWLGSFGLFALFGTSYLVSLTVCFLSFEGRLSLSPSISLPPSA